MRIAEQRGMKYPKTLTAFGLRACNINFTSKNNFRWAFPGHWTTAEGPFLEGTHECPEKPGDGICVGKTWGGMASGCIPAIMVLLVGWEAKAELGSNSEKTRLRRAYVIDVLTVSELLQERTTDEALNLRSANLYGADLSGANLSGANLSGATLKRANLRSANLRSANLSGANLSGATLKGAELYGAHLKGANLYGANLYGANLYGANLKRANLSGANLYGANLRSADLSGANLYGANLRSADLYGANLYGAFNVPAEYQKAK